MEGTESPPEADASFRLSPTPILPRLPAVLLVAALGAAASAQPLTEFEGRVLSGALFGPVYADAQVALAIADSTGMWPEAEDLPNGSRLVFEARTDGGWAVAFESRPHAPADTLQIGALSGTLLLPAPSADSCVMAYGGTVDSGQVVWGRRGDLDAEGVTSGLRRCWVE